jgi:hypothetical protein
LQEDEYYSLTLKLVTEGLIDVVIPGMEPLLRQELWAVLDAAKDANARSVGITTNGTLLAKHATRLHESALSVINVSLDGPPNVHDGIRGTGVFQKIESGIRAFRKVSNKRLITNTTVHRENVALLTDIAEISLKWGADYSAFHPFEFASEAENSLATSAGEVVQAYVRLIEAFRTDCTGSIVVEAEASTLSVIALLAETGVLDGCRLVVDEAGYFYLHEERGNRELLVSLMFYPHHFIRTIRVADDGGLSSCRSMARTGWEGVGDLRVQSVGQALGTEAARAALALIWGEFNAAKSTLPTGAFEHLGDFLRSRIDRTPTRKPVTAA